MTQFITVEHSIDSQRFTIDAAMSDTGVTTSIATLALWRLLAPNIVPTHNDCESILRLMKDVRFNLREHFHDGLRHVRLAWHPDPSLEFPAIDIWPVGNHKLVHPLATAWIEFNGTPDAFFYWES